MLNKMMRIKEKNKKLMMDDDIWKGVINDFHERNADL